MPELRASIAQHYHDRTKYDPETIRAKGHPLDWSQQPIAYKNYQIGTTFDLKPYLPRQSAEISASWWQRLSRLLYASYGLTGTIPQIGEPIYLRAAPSAGGLYPAEIYLISRGTPTLPAGLYNYQAKTHSLLHFWADEVWTALQSACFWNPLLEGTQLAIVITAVFARSAWRYQDRAYRRIFLDTGHLLGNLELAGSVTDFRPHLLGGFADQAVNDLLYLDGVQEGAIAVLPLADRREVNQNLALTRTALPAVTQTDYPRLGDGDLLQYFHQATQIANADVKVDWRQRREPDAPVDNYNFPFCLKVPMATMAINWGDQLTGLEATLLKRRSTREYSGAAITLAELKAVLDFTYQPQNYIEQALDDAPDYFELGLVETFIAV